MDIQIFKTKPQTLGSFAIDYMLNYLGLARPDNKEDNDICKAQDLIH